MRKKGNFHLNISVLQCSLSRDKYQIVHCRKSILRIKGEHAISTSAARPLNHLTHDPRPTLVQQGC